MQSAKNILQEYCQQKRLPLPTYNTSWEELGWQSEVTILDGKIFEGEVCTTKVKAEQSAAQVALESLIEKQEKKHTKDGYFAILVDLENQPKVVEELISQVILTEKVRIFSFSFGSHPSVKKLAELLFRFEGPIEHEFVAHGCTRADATDIMMCIWIGANQRKLDKYQFLIVTKDHFGDTACCLLNNMKAFHTTEELIDYICIKE